jgi:hypothetical protein
MMDAHDFLTWLQEIHIFFSILIQMGYNIRTHWQKLIHSWTAVYTIYSNMMKQNRFFISNDISTFLDNIKKTIRDWQELQDSWKSDFALFSSVKPTLNYIIPWTLSLARLLFCTEEEIFSNNIFLRNTKTYRLRDMTWVYFWKEPKTLHRPWHLCKL